MLRASSNLYKVLAPTALFGTVRVARGDIVRRELLGAGIRRLIESGVIEPIGVTSKRNSARLI